MKNMMRAFVCVVVLAVLGPGLGVAQPTGVSSFEEGLSAYRAGHPQEAIPALERALAADSSQVQAYVVLSSALLQTGKPDRAQRVAEAGRSRFPNRLSLRFARAEALMKQKRWSEALDAYRAIEQQHGADTPLPPDVSIDQVRTRIGQLHRLVGQTHVEAERLGSALRHFKAARSFLPDSAASYADVAALHLRREDWRAALDAAERGLERAPDHVRLLQLRSEALVRLKRPEAAVSSLRQLYRRRPDDLNVGLAYGRALSASGQADAAQQVFSTLLDRHPDTPRVYEALVRMNEQRGNYDAALEVLRRQREQFPEDPDVALRMGRLYEKKGEYGAARAVYDSAQAVAGPDDWTPALARARTFEAQDSLVAAVQAYRSLLKRTPGHETALRRLGRVYEQQEAWAEARAVYDRLRSGPADSTDVYVKLGRVHEGLGNTEAAFSAYRTAVEKGAGHPRAHYRYAALLHARPDSTGAFRAAERALRTGLRTLEQFRKGQLQKLRTSGRGGPPWNQERVRDRYETYNRIAKEAFRFFANSFPADRTEPVIADLLQEYPEDGRLHYLVGMYYESQGRTEEALRQYRRAVRVAPDLHAAHRALGALYEERNELRRAIRSYERARSLAPDRPEAYRALLRLYEQRGRLETLIRRWQTRYQSSPDNDVLRSHLIEALHKTGQYEEARRIGSTDTAPSS
jgi:tetratricopeptide (TPR) repeat protein